MTTTARINVELDASQAMAQLRALQAQMQAFGARQVASSATMAAAQKAHTQSFLDQVNATRMWTAEMVNANSHVDRFSKNLERGKLSMGEYFRYGATQSRLFRRVFQTEFDTIDRLAKQRVRSLQTQYVAMERAANGAVRAAAIRPTDQAMNWSSAAAQAAVASQRQQIWNKVMRDGSTAMVNWGKNTQWAGRQLMVGFSIPLGIAGAMAAKTFMDLEKAGIQFKRVYGDLSTPTGEAEKNLKAIQALGAEYAKYGISVAQTVDISARAAATGLQNQDLLAGTEQTLRLATLGQMDYQQALEATITLQTAFGISSNDLGKTIDYLNAAENQTILSLDDITKAIPRVAPVIKGLGGNVQDLAVMMTALREGGVTAEQGANALKSGLGSLINPTDTATTMLKGLGINIKKMVKDNEGDLMGMVTEFGEAISKLSNLERQQVLEKLFGKYQYARMGALFKNLARNGSQAQRAMELAGMSTQELATLSERELSKISDSVTFKFTAAIERFKLAIAPIGEIFLKAVTPIIDFGTRLFEAFNSWPDGVKQAVTIAVAAIAGIAPVVLMTIGLIGNGLGNLMKTINMVRGAFARMRGRPSGFQTGAELEEAAMMASLEGKINSATQAVIIQENAVLALKSAYESMAGAASAAMARTTSASANAAQVVNPVVAATTGPKFTPADIEPQARARGDLVAAHITMSRTLTPQQIAEYERLAASGALGSDAVTILNKAKTQSSELTGLSNATVMLSRKTNWDLFKNKQAVSGLVEDIQQGGMGFGVPLARIMAQHAGGARNSKQVLELFKTPEYKSFLEELPRRVVTDLAHQFRAGDIIGDAQFGPIVQNAARDLVARQFGVDSNEMRQLDRAINEIHMLQAGDHGRAPINSDLTGQTSYKNSSIDDTVLKAIQNDPNFKQAKVVIVDPSGTPVSLLGPDGRPLQAQAEEVEPKPKPAPTPPVRQAPRTVIAVDSSGQAERVAAKGSEISGRNVDPLLNRPTLPSVSQTEAQRRSVFQRMRGISAGRAMFGAGMAMDAASMGMMFSGNEQMASLGQKLMPVGMIASLAGMLPGPFAAAAAAAAALGAVFIAGINSQQALSDATGKLVYAMNGSSKGLSLLSEMFNRKGPQEKMQALLSGVKVNARGEIKGKSAQRGLELLQTEAGQALFQQWNQLGGVERTNAIISDLTSGVLTGTVKAKEAKDLARALSVQFGDANLAQTIMDGISGVFVGRGEDRRIRRGRGSMMASMYGVPEYNMDQIAGLDAYDNVGMGALANFGRINASNNLMSKLAMTSGVGMIAKLASNFVPASEEAASAIQNLGDTSVQLNTAQAQNFMDFKQGRIAYDEYRVTQDMITKKNLEVADALSQINSTIGPDAFGGVMLKLAENAGLTADEFKAVEKSARYVADWTSQGGTKSRERATTAIELGLISKTISQGEVDFFKSLIQEDSDIQRQVTLLFNMPGGEEHAAEIVDFYNAINMEDPNTKRQIDIIINNNPQAMVTLLDQWKTLASTPGKLKKVLEMASEGIAADDLDDLISGWQRLKSLPDTLRKKVEVLGEDGIVGMERAIDRVTGKNGEISKRKVKAQFGVDVDTKNWDDLTREMRIKRVIQAWVKVDTKEVKHAKKVLEDLQGTGAASTSREEYYSNIANKDLQPSVTGQIDGWNIVKELEDPHVTGIVDQWQVPSLPTPGVEGTVSIPWEWSRNVGGYIPSPRPRGATGSPRPSGSGTIPGTTGVTAQRQPGPRPGIPANRGGWIMLNSGRWVPGGTDGPNRDSVPALLTPGEFVVTRDQAQKHRALLEDINAGRNGYAEGGMVKKFIKGIGPGGPIVGRYEALSMTKKMIKSEFSEQLMSLIMAAENPAKLMKKLLDKSSDKLKKAIKDMEKRLKAEQFISGISQIVDYIAQEGLRVKAAARAVTLGVNDTAAEAIGPEGVMAISRQLGPRPKNKKKLKAWKKKRAQLVGQVNDAANQSVRDEFAAGDSEINAYGALKPLGNDFLKKVAESGVSFEEVQRWRDAGVSLEDINTELQKRIDAQKEINDLNKTDEERLQEAADAAEELVSALDAVWSAQQRINEATANLEIIRDYGKDMRQVALEREQHENDIAQIQREQIDTRQTQIDLLSHENEVLQRGVDKVNEAYDQQFAALDAIAAKEQQISGLKQGQLSLADALSKGDIAGAARARNDYMSQYAQYATESTRKALEAQRDAATYQARERIRLNDEAIWNLNQQIYDVQQSQIKPLQDQLVELDKVEQAYNDIRIKADLSSLTTPTDDENPLVKYWNAVSAAAKAALAAGQAAVAANGGVVNNTPADGQDNANTGGTGGSTGGTTPMPSFWDLFLLSFKNLGDGDKEWVKNKIFGGQVRGDGFANWLSLWNKLGDNKRKAAFNVIQGGVSSEEMKSWTPFKYAAGGLVPGVGSMDSVSAMLTPGEFVVNKAASAKFRALLEQINASGGPRFNVPGTNSGAGISAGVYNNNASYTINVAVNGTNASPDDIANAIMSRIQQTENMKIRSYRY